MNDRRRNAAPTLEDVAQAAGVSRALVSLVMRGSPRVSAQSRQRVLQSAAKLGYRPNLMARNLAARRTMTLGLLLNDLHNPWFADVADGVHDVAEQNGYQLILASGRRKNQLESRALDTFLASRVDGIIVAGCRLPTSRILEVALEVPLVSIGRMIRGTLIGNVTTDDALGARLAVEHLVGARSPTHRAHRWWQRCRCGAAPRRVYTCDARTRPRRARPCHTRRLHRGSRFQRRAAGHANQTAANSNLHGERLVGGWCHRSRSRGTG